MSRPPLQLARPARSQSRIEESALRPAPSPAINLESPEVQAYSLKGRVTIPSPVEESTAEGVLAPIRLPASTPEFEAPSDSVIADDPWRHVAIKLPAVSGQKLSQIADLRCSKRTRIALELLDRPLRDLARGHRAGECPPLRRVSAGAARSGVSLILPKDLADDLRYIVETRGAVKAQILTRILVPAIDALYIKEILGRPS